MTLISYEQALGLMREAIVAKPSVVALPLDSSEGLALAESVIAARPNPAFDNSAVDGYLIGHEGDAQKGKTLRVAATIVAGTAQCPKIAPGACARVFTGGLVPAWGYGVVMQENVRLISDDTILLEREVPSGHNIRRKGTDFREGDVLANVGDTISPSVIALLASQGYSKVRAHAPPSCAVVTTGDELVGEDSCATEGKVMDSNGPMLCSLIVKSGCARPAFERLPDNRRLVRNRLKALAKSHDLVVVSGGASVGDFDFVRQAVADIGDLIFHGVAIKPGKPVLMGRMQSCVIFGLPGNPASAYVTFELFVREAILRLGGHKAAVGLWIRIPFLEDWVTNDREEFLRARLSLEGARLCCEQGSFGLLSMARANCLVRMPAKTRHTAGQLRDALILQ